jgi:hypothetical protein
MIRRHPFERMCAVSILGAVSGGCAGARAPVDLPPLRCPLDEAVLSATVPGAVECGGPDSGVDGQGSDHGEQLRTCVLAAARDHAPFYALWTNNMTDGVGTRRGIAGRPTIAGYELRWFAYQLVSGYDPTGHSSDTRTHERWTSDACPALVDLRAVCPWQGAPTAEAAQIPACRASRSERHDDLELACATRARVGACSDPPD